jgi:hypothetical protein
MIVRTSKHAKGGERPASPPAQAEIETSPSTSVSFASDAAVAADDEEYEPLYPPILQSSSSMFPSVPPLAFADMSFNPMTARGHIDENAALSSADQEFVTYIETLLRAGRS